MIQASSEQEDIHFEDPVTRRVLFVVFHTYDSSYSSQNHCDTILLVLKYCRAFVGHIPPECRTIESLFGICNFCHATYQKRYLWPIN